MDPAHHLCRDSDITPLSGDCRTPLDRMGVPFGQRTFSYQPSFVRQLFEYTDREGRRRRLQVLQRATGATHFRPDPVVRQVSDQSDSVVILCLAHRTNRDSRDTGGSHRSNLMRYSRVLGQRLGRRKPHGAVWALRQAADRGAFQALHQASTPYARLRAARW